MKKINYFIAIIMLLFVITACGNNKKSIIPSETTTIKESSSSICSSISSGSNSSTASSSISSEASSSKKSSTTTIPSSSSDLNVSYNIKEILTIGSTLNEGEVGIKVNFEGMYLKLITDNMDKLMLFADDCAYINVRVKSGDFTTHLKKRYLNCYYNVLGNVTKNNNQIEIAYEKIENKTSTPEAFDFTNLTKKCNSIGEVYNDIKKVSLTNKKNGVGNIVTFNGVVIATDRSDSNSKAVLYDNKNIITIISEKKICDGFTDLDKEFIVTGIISIKNGAPAVLLLDLKSAQKTINIDYSNAKAVNPSYFASWYHLSDNIKDPGYDDFSTLYLVSGYINIDDSRKNAYYFGMTDNSNNTLSDTGIKTSIKGIYLMNHLNVKNSILSDYYMNETKVSMYCSLYQFDSQNHGWKAFPIESTIKSI